MPGIVPADDLPSTIVPADDLPDQAPPASWLGAAKGDAEAAMALGSGGLMAGVGGLARTVNRALPEWVGGAGSKAAVQSDIDNLQQRLTYKPQSPEGQYALSQIAGVTQPIGNLAHKAAAAVVGEDNVPAVSDAFAAGGLLKGIASGGPPVTALTPEQAATRAAQLQLLKREGVRLDSSQDLGSKAALVAKNFANDGPYGSPAEFQAGQAGDFTQAAMKQIGLPVREASPSNMQVAKKALQAAYNKVAGETSMSLDDPLAQALDKIQQDARESLTPENAAVINNKVESLLTMMERNGSKLSGDQYQKFQQGLSDIAKDGGKAPFVTQLRQAVTGMLERQANPDNVALLKQTNQRWGAMKAIAKAIDDKNQISPAKLYNAMDTAKGEAQSVFGQGPNQQLMELAQAGKSVLGTNTPNSGTFARAAGAAAIIEGAQALMAAATGDFSHAGTLAATAAAAGLSQKAAQALVYTKAGKAFLQKAAQAKLATSGLLGKGAANVQTLGLGVQGADQAAQPQQ